MQDVSRVEVLGLTAEGMPGSAAQPLALTALFFAGPLLCRLSDPRFCYDLMDVGAGIHSTLMRSFNDKQSNSVWAASKQCLAEVMRFLDRNLIGVRNYIIAPVAEEFAFRACMYPLLRTQVREKLQDYNAVS